MQSVSNSVGIDIAKDRLDLGFGQEKVKTFSNDFKGVNALIQALPENAEVHYEPSGGYERLLVQALQERGIPAFAHNPRRVRRMADAMGISAKTDALDAKVLAQLKGLGKPTRPKSAKKTQICDLSRTIQSLKNDRTRNLKRLKTPELAKQVQLALKEVIAALEKQIQVLENAFVQSLEQTQHKEDYRRAQTVPSIGKQTARALVSELPEDYQRMSGPQVSSYTGVAPFDDSSGKRNGPRHIRHGNTHLKSAMYMAAISCIRFQPWAKQLYTRLRAQGKPHEVAIVAVMRRLLLRVFAVLKRGSDWETEPPKR